MRSLFCVLFLTVMAVPSLLVAGDDFKLEPGYTLLFNGKNLDGWKTKTGNASLDGKTEAYKGRFSVKDGTIVIDPKVKGDVIIQTARSFDKDVHIKFEFLPAKGCNNDLFIRGHKFDLVKGNVKNFKEGEWHQFEIIVKGDATQFKCNGETQRTAKNKSASSPLGIRAEFGAIQIRRIRFKEAS